MAADITPAQYLAEAEELHARMVETTDMDEFARLRRLAGMAMAGYREAKAMQQARQQYAGRIAARRARDLAMATLD